MLQILEGTDWVLVISVSIFINISKSVINYTFVAGGIFLMIRRMMNSGRRGGFNSLEFPFLFFFFLRS